jgi:hypothetical protein
MIELMVIKWEVALECHCWVVISWHQLHKSVTSVSSDKDEESVVIPGNLNVFAASAN